MLLERISVFSRHVWQGSAAGGNVAPFTTRLGNAFGRHMENNAVFNSMCVRIAYGITARYHGASYKGPGLRLGINESVQRDKECS